VSRVRKTSHKFRRSEATPWVDAEDSVDLPTIVREIVTEPHAIEVVPWEEAVRRDDFNTEPTDGTPAR
jgi:hypothetical protein